MSRKKVKLAILSSGDPKTCPSARFRIYQLLPFIEASEDVHIKGTIIINRGLSMTTTIRAMLKLIYLCLISDILFVQKARIPNRLLTLLRALTKIIYDFDDSNFLPPPSWDTSNDFTVRKERVHVCLKGSNLVIAGNQYLADYAYQFSHQVNIIPTVVTTDSVMPDDSYSWGIPPQIYLPRSSIASDNLTIGWIGSGEHVRQLDQILVALIQLQKQYGVAIKVVSDQKWEPTGLAVRNKTWILEEEVQDVQSFDIGVMPLDADDPFLKGKCAFKAIEYMAVGIPVVATAVGANKDVIAHGKTGYLVENVTDWEIYLEKLITNFHLRKAIGQTARAWTKKHYSVESVLPDYLDIFKRI